MCARRQTPPGFTLVEILIVLTLMAIVSAMAAPAFRNAAAASRAHRALDRLTAEIYRARSLALESGFPARVVLQHDPDGCSRSVRITSGPPGGAAERSIHVDLDLPDQCLLHTGDSTLVFNGRGMLRPPGRTFFVETQTGTPSVVISVGGRIRRTY